MQSKENKILEIFFENPTKEWHFEEILKEAKIARSKANSWLKKLKKENLIKKIKEKNKMPYYIADYESPSYQNKKRIYALNKFYETGFLNHLLSLKKAGTIILFGSYSRWDWYKNSDIDLFIYGDPEGFEMAKYEIKLHKNIQLFNPTNKKELNRLGEGLIRNIIKGITLKGNLDFIGIKTNA